MDVIAYRAAYRLAEMAAKKGERDDARAFGRVLDRAMMVVAAISRPGLVAALARSYDRRFKQRSKEP